jgi:SAM-dependent methyltransferase
VRDELLSLPVAGRHHWFEDLADQLGSAYLRYSFTLGTEQEVDHLVEVLGLGPGDRVLDVGCGPGRHVAALGARGTEVVGVDISARFLQVASSRAPGSLLVRGDARWLPFGPCFDAAISVCQGAFGLTGGPADPGGDDPVAPDPDLALLREVARCLRPGGILALTAFSSYHQVHHLAEGADGFDVGRGVHHETTEVRDELGGRHPAELWTSCYTPRELRLMCSLVGLVPESISSVGPGDHAHRPPGLDHPELLLTASRPRTPAGGPQPAS